MDSTNKYLYFIINLPLPCIKPLQSWGVASRDHAEVLKKVAPTFTDIILYYPSQWIPWGRWSRGCGSFPNHHLHALLPWFWNKRWSWVKLYKRGDFWEIKRQTSRKLFTTKKRSQDNPKTKWTWYHPIAVSLSFTMRNGSLLLSATNKLTGCLNCWRRWLAYTNWSYIAILTSKLLKLIMRKHKRCFKPINWRGNR